MKKHNLNSLSNESVSVKEFAKKAGVSSQAIYKQLDKKLSTYTIKVGNRTMVNLSALKDVYGIDELQTETNQVDNQVDNQNQPQDNITQEFIQTLKEQLDIKDKQIALLQKQLDQEQQLRLVEHQKVLELQEPKWRAWFSFKKKSL